MSTTLKTENAYYEPFTLVRTEDGNLWQCACEQIGGGEINLCSQCNKVLSHRDHITDTRCHKCQYVDNYNKVLNPDREWSKEDTFRLQIMIALQMTYPQMETKMNINNAHQRIISHKTGLIRGLCGYALQNIYRNKNKNGNKSEIESKPKSEKCLIVICDLCESKIGETDKVYHCGNERNNKFHSEGYDICVPCFDGIYGGTVYKHCICGSEFIIKTANECYKTECKNERKAMINAYKPRAVKRRKLNSKEEMDYNNIDFAMEEMRKRYDSQIEELKSDILELKNEVNSRKENEQIIMEQLRQANTDIQELNAKLK